MGEKRRLAFASVLSLAPSFVVFDEPTCGLDPASVGRFFRLVNELRKMGVGQIIISHDGNVLKALADRVLWLSGASGIAELGTDELFAGDGCAGIVSSPTTEQDLLGCHG
jgi:energy-coupling factor transporter ATP-binding protein EcfA2